MNEQQLRGLIGRVKAGKMSRRAFVKRMVAVGLTAPLANQMLAHNGVAVAATKFDYKPTDAHLGPQNALLTILTLAGLAGVSDPVLPRRSTAPRA